MLIESETLKAALIFNDKTGEITVPNMREVFRVIDSQPPFNPWHRVEDELPNEKGPYITAYYDGYVGENVWHFIGETAVGWMYDADAVRYWMTMPEPPKEET